MKPNNSFAEDQTKQPQTLTLNQALQLAIEHHRAGQLKDAERLYRVILQAQPTHSDANHNLGILAVGLNQTSVGLPYLKAAIESNPNQGQYWLSYVDALIKEKQFDNAKSILERGKKLGLAGEQVDALTRQLMPMALVQESESTEKRQNPPLLELRKKVSAKEKKRKNSSTNQRNLIQIRNPSQTEVNDLLEHYQKGRYDAAEKLAISITQKFPNHQFSWKVLGVVLYQAGKLHESLTANQKAMELVPKDAEAHSNLGNTLKEVGRLEDAEASYRKAIALKPDYADAHYNLGITLKELGRLEDAEASYRKSIELKPDYVKALSNLGITLKELGRLEDAEASYKKAIALKPDNAEAHYNLGITLKELGSLEDCEASYRKAIALKPGYAEAQSGLMLLFQQQGLFPEALELAGNILRDLAAQNQLNSIESEITSHVVALLPFGRSGSLFFHSLFDGHPELATLPGIYFKGWFGHDVWKRFAPNLKNAKWRERLVEKIIQEFQPLFDARSQKNVVGTPMDNSKWLARDSGFMEMGADHSQPFVIDQNSFSSNLITLLTNLSSVSQKSCFELIHRAFEITVRGNNSAKNNEVSRIFYHIHNPIILEFAHFLCHYPQARLLYIVRHPLQAIESWMLIDVEEGTAPPNSVKNGNTNNKLIDDSLLISWSKAVSKSETMFGDLCSPFNALTISRGVRLEDVKRYPKRVMPQIAAWMGIVDHPVLYEASFCGMQYWGPASGLTGKITGFDTKAIDHPVGRLLGTRDILIFETLFWPFSHRYGYTELDEPGFRRQLNEIRPWLNEPLEFETNLYAQLKSHRVALQDLVPYIRLHRLLVQFWMLLDRDGTYQGMVQPLELSN